MHEKVRLPRWHRKLVPFALAALGLLGLGFAPQFAGPGYEAALAAGTVLPSIAAIATALEIARARPSASEAVGRGATIGALLAVTGFVTVLVHGLRVGFCDPTEGLWLYVLGPGFGAVLGGVTGAVAGFFLGRARRPRRRWARVTVLVLLGLAGPLLGVVVSLGRFLTSPMVFAFDPYFGVFSGPLYDTVVSVVDRLLTYRQGTALTLAAVALGARLLDASLERGARAALRERPGFTVLAALLAAGSLWHSASGPRFGHWSTSASIEETLGAKTSGKRCDVVHARALPLRDVRLFAKDCDASLAAVEAYFGARGPARVKVYLFASDGEKGWLMGASHTYIAKPWRAEVYVQAAPFPHPVLQHELAHVVSGSFARGPFRVAGPLGGWFPDPGRIEGFAVAAALDDDDELTPEEWAASMLKLGLLPELRQVFELDFLGFNAAKAYTVAGAFVGYLRATYGSAALRRWYAGEPLESVTNGKGLPALERDFRAALARTRVPERALATAQARFERPSFFARRCPRIVDRALGDASMKLDVGDVRGARDGFDEALALDQGNVEARFGLAGCARQAGELDRSLELHLALTRADDVPKIQRARALETAADIELSRGRGGSAKTLYDAAEKLVFSEDRQRTLQVKSLASEGSGREAIVTLLVGQGEFGPAWDAAAPLVQAWADREPDHDLPPYLIGRNLFGAGRYAAAARYLDQSLALEPRLASVRREAIRLRLIAACALGDVPGVEKALESALADPELRSARRLGLTRFAERCGVTLVAGRNTTTAVLPPPERADPSAGAPPSKTPRAPSGSLTCPPGMVLLPGGRFWVGSEASAQRSPDESPRYLTELAPFCLDETEVTVKAYEACVAKRKCPAPAKTGLLCNVGRPERADHPANCVTWGAAHWFCETDGKRLPVEAEFEFAARGGAEYRKYPWGDEPPDGRTCWKHNGSCPVKTYAAAAFGLFDVSGNVWEWTDDPYGPYPWPPETGEAKVYRGGSFSRRFEKWMDPRLRNRSRESDAGAHLGFRCALTPDTARCPFGAESVGRCLHGVLDRECGEGRSFNGVRCVKPGEPRCAAGWVEKEAHGCLPEHEIEPEIEDIQASIGLVTHVPSPEFDADCRANQPGRPRAFRYAGGTHAARNFVSKGSGCKNRDVGVGWNSTCCP
jgi:formylglycine-generating enzyme required for sulfatase activity